MNHKWPAVSRQGSKPGFARFFKAIILLLFSFKINLVWCKGGAAISGKGAGLGNQGGEYSALLLFLALFLAFDM